MESGLDPLVLEFVGDGPKKRKEIEEWLKDEIHAGFTPRTLTNVLHRLREKRLIRKIGWGVYAPITYVTLEEAILLIRRVINILAGSYFEVTLAEVSKYAMIPESWSFRRGEVEISFEDLVHAVVRRKVMEAEKADLDIPVVLIGDKTREKPSPIRERDEKKARSLLQEKGRKEKETKEGE